VAKKVTVSMPDMLYQKMERWRRSFNLSQMLQEAVAEAIQKKEDFQKRVQEDLDITEVVERLRREKAQSEGNFFDTGRRDGVAWAKSAGYDDIMYALSWDNIDKAPSDKILGSYFLEKIESSKLMQLDGETINEYTRIYLQGWKKGLSEFWEVIRDKI
jgi:Arc/MetJ-type ribon-helix-helix transcriptional regulator